MISLKNNLYILVLFAGAGCGGQRPGGTVYNDRMVYIDTATSQPIVASAAGEYPASHPTTGQRTLMPALYCPSCQSWHAAPPPEQINRLPHAGRCAKTGAQLTLDGPWPETSQK